MSERRFDCAVKDISTKILNSTDALIFRTFMHVNSKKNLYKKRSIILNKNKQKLFYSTNIGNFFCYNQKLNYFLTAESVELVYAFMRANKKIKKIQFVFDC